MTGLPQSKEQVMCCSPTRLLSSSSQPRHCPQKTPLSHEHKEFFPWLLYVKVQTQNSFSVWPNSTLSRVTDQPGPAIPPLQVWLGKCAGNRRHCPVWMEPTSNIIGEMIGHCHNIKDSLKPGPKHHVILEVS